VHDCWQAPDVHSSVVGERFQGRTTDGYEANRWTDGEADRGAAVFLAVASDAALVGGVSVTARQLRLNPTQLRERLQATQQQATSEEQPRFAQEADTLVLSV
jgi:hypothetical protein